MWDGRQSPLPASHAGTRSSTPHAGAVRGRFQEDSAAGGWKASWPESSELQLEGMASPLKNTEKRFLFLVESLNFC